ARVNLSATMEHINVHMVLDNTGSMNIVDGVAAINQMRPLFKPYEKFGAIEDCAFACHVKIDGSGKDVTYNGKSGSEIARENGIPMREDRIHREMIDQAQRLLQGASNIKVAVYAFDWSITKLIDPSDNFGRVKNAIDNVTNVSQGTQYEIMAPQVDFQVGLSGVGTELDPKKVIVLITDGVQQRFPDHKPGLMPIEACDKMKEDGRELYVLNIAYPDPDIIGGDQRPGGSPSEVKAFYNDIDPRMKACATSPDHYFRADYGVTIDRALKKITDKIMVGGSKSSFYMSM
ncbi:MAG: vWA domain-containing protein, partial [Notoacmeibacter sp.]